MIDMLSWGAVRDAAACRGRAGMGARESALESTRTPRPGLPAAPRTTCAQQSRRSFSLQVHIGRAASGTLCDARCSGCEPANSAGCESRACSARCQRRSFCGRIQHNTCSPCIRRKSAADHAARRVVGGRVRVPAGSAARASFWATNRAAAPRLHDNTRRAPRDGARPRPAHGDLTRMLHTRQGGSTVNSQPRPHDARLRRP